jgi:glycosyltransferase involved in cell wall biosynthesis
MDYERWWSGSAIGPWSVREERWPAAPAPVVPVAELPNQPGPPRIKILHVITKLTEGAGGNTLLSALGADRTRFEVWIAGAAGGPLWERAERNGVRTVKLMRFRAGISALDDLWVLVELWRLIRRERFSVVHTHSSKAGFLGRLAAWLCRTPVVVHTIHGFSFHDFMSPRRRWAYLVLERLVRPTTDAFIAVAPQVAREAVERHLVTPGAITVVPSAIEVDEILDQPDRGLRARLGIPDDVPVVGTVGRVDFQKAPLDFVRMAAHVAAARPRARFVMVGHGALLEETRAEARRLGVDVTFTGFRDDAARLAGCFDVYVVSSLYEGLGRSLTEALASGRPVCATNVNGVVDLIEPGATGLLARPRQPEALAECVIWMLDHPAEARRMGAAGRERVSGLFMPGLMCRRIEEIYASLLGLPDVAVGGRSVRAESKDDGKAAPHYAGE